MSSKHEVAVDLLSRIRIDRIRVANQELSIIPPALKLGLSAEEVARLTGAPIERVKELERR